MKGKITKKLSRIRRSIKFRKKNKFSDIFRLVVHRSSKHIYAQIIENSTAKVVTYASTLEKKKFFYVKKEYTGNKRAASFIGSLIASRALKKGIKRVSFDRSGFKYHGRIKSLAESARISGLLF